MKTNLNDVGIRYEDIGNGPAIMVIHDGPSNREIGMLFAPLAEAGYRVIVTHLDGFGKKRTSGADLSAYSRNAVALLDFLGIGRAVIFGIGLGGIVLLDILDTSPGRVAGSSLVLGSATADQIRQLTHQLEVNAGLKEGHLSALREGLLSALPAARKDKTACSPLTNLRARIDGLLSRNLYLSFIQHRSILRTGIDIPPLIVESADGHVEGRRAQRRKASIPSRGWNKIKGVNAHLVALIQFLSPPEEEVDEEEIPCGLP
jgi:pimeloyl-ACP methyl ester carboxylesterase